MVPLVIGVVVVAVIILAVIILGSVIIIIHSIKHPPKQTGESTCNSSGKLELTAVHSAGSMLEIDNSYYASAGQKHDSNENDHTYSVIESGTTPSGDGNPAPLYASIEEKVETREGSSTSEGREDTHTYSVVNKKLSRENESHTPEGQDDSHVYSVVNKKFAKEKAKDEQDEASIKMSKDFSRPEGHIYSVVKKKGKAKDEQDEVSVQKIKTSKELPKLEGQDDSHVYSVVKKKLAKEEETCNEEDNTLNLLYAVVDKKRKTVEAPADLEKTPKMSTDNREEEVISY